MEFSVKIDWVLNPSPPIKNSNLIIHLNGMCLLLVDKYSEDISVQDYHYNQTQIKIFQL